ncbi:Rossmann-like domain-containing protein [Methanocrinis sp.]|uniref:Rossmann-like domain-containing protein n=1 Tax=Methanocrinis sp. TaxID=3101522 RepID=UPI003D09DC3F
MNGEEIRKPDLLEMARAKFIDELDHWCDQRGVSRDDLDDRVVATRPLSSFEAIGSPERDDFPLLRGKEVLMEANYRGSLGQAFTSAAGVFSGTLEEVLELSLEDAFDRAVLVSTINAVLRNLGLVEGTVHCRDSGPEDCATDLGRWLREEEADRAGLVGMQPALLSSLVEILGSENVMVSDLACAGEVRLGVRVLDGMAPELLFERSPLVLITGTTLVNGTVDALLETADGYGCRAVFYGTTIAGAARLLGLERWCSCSK